MPGSQLSAASVVLRDESLALQPTSQVEINARVTDTTLKPRLRSRRPLVIMYSQRVYTNFRLRSASSRGARSESARSMVAEGDEQAARRKDRRRCRRDTR